MNNWPLLRPHQKQYDAWTTPYRFVGLAAGRGSGKSELSRRRIVRYLPVKKPWPDPIYFYALPTFAQAKRVGWNKILQLIPQGWIKSDNVSELMIETVFGTKLYLVGMDKPQRIEGDQWDGCVLDESCDLKPGTFEKSVLPALSHRNGWCWRIGVPKWNGIGAQSFKNFFDLGQSGKPIPGTNEKVISYTWPSSDILSEEQISFARATLSDKDFTEQYEASWVDAGGLIYYAFGDKNVERCSYRRNYPIFVGQDFNVDPMAWVLSHRVDQKLEVFDEIFVRNTSTPACLEILHQKYGAHENGFVFFPDASGRARKTSASKSDLLHIQGFDKLSNKRIIVDKSNPRVADRFASVNALMHHTGCLIDQGCKNLIKDLKGYAYKPGSSEPSKAIDRGHASDALGYIIHKVFPIRLPTGDEILNASLQ